MTVQAAGHAAATLVARQQLSQGLEEQIAALRVQRVPRRVAEIAFFSMLWVAGIALGVAGLAAAGSLEWPLRMLGIGAAALALNAFYLLSHDGHHHLLFRDRRANHAANMALCVPLLHSPTSYRVLHDLHHRFLGGPGDPDEYRNYTSNARLRWALHWVRLTIGTLVYMPLIPIVAWRRAGSADRRRMALELSAMAAVWIAVFSSVPIRVLLQVWLIPGVVVGYISAVRAVAQHALTPEGDPLLASRSVQSNAVVSFFLLNENYHLEHHLFPEVPSYHLPRLRALLRSRLPHSVEAPSYSRFLAGFVGRFLHGDESPLGVHRHAAPLAEPTTWR
ncbi:MAG: fatty acid desaturase [Vicinamibacterales bacterium]